MATPGTIACLPIGQQGVLYLSGSPSEGRLRSRAKMRLEALVRLAGALLSEPPPPPVVHIPGLVGNTRPMQELFASIRSFAPMPWPALILGETGTGKEAVARALHSLSPRADAPFLAINCATIPESLAESLLFGHEKGSFTGSDRRKEGIVERVKGGTLFLDEVGELPPSVQAKLLRLLQEGRFERVGGGQELRFAGRVVAATLRTLEQSHGKEGFRSDLFHRLAACVLRVPPLRERREDIPALALCLVERSCQQISITPLLLSNAAADLQQLLSMVSLEQRQQFLGAREEGGATGALVLPPRYIYQKLLGTSGMGEVHRVTDQVLGRDVALKLLRADCRHIHARFVEEARGTARLVHPAIVPVYDAGILEDGRPWFTMREVQGRQLAEVITAVHAASTPERWGSSADGWNFPRLLNAFLTVAEAVGYAHDQGVIHRDLKPQNILVGDYGEVLVVDWGLARSEVLDSIPDFSGGPSREGHTQVGAILGTPAYMAPEQARGEPADRRSDVYALGVILYQLCTCHLPVVGNSMEEILTGVRLGRVQPLQDPRVPEELAQLCGQLLRLEAAQRPPDAAVVARALRSYQEGLRRRERALELVKEAVQRREEATTAGQAAHRAEEEARLALAGIPPWAPAAQKQEAWEREAAAAAFLA